MKSLTIVMYHYVRPIKKSLYPLIKGLELYSSPPAILSPRPAARITAVLILLFKGELDCPINC